MIKNKKDLAYFIEQDCIRCTGGRKIGFFRLAMNCFYGNDKYRVFRYLCALRRYEYFLNCQRGVIGKLQCLIAKVRWHRLGAKYNINILPNTVGYGFICYHLTGGVIINAEKVGNYCSANPGVIVGQKDRKKPIIGDNVELCIGCKVLGGISIGDDVIVAPNAVVVKDVPSNAVVAGVPAKIIKIKS